MLIQLSDVYYSLVFILELMTQKIFVSVVNQFCNNTTTAFDAIKTYRLHKTIKKYRRKIPKLISATTLRQIKPKWHSKNACAMIRKKRNKIKFANYVSVNNSR